MGTINGQSTAAFKREPHRFSKTEKWVSETEYWQTYYEHPDHNYEWNNGRLEEKPMPDLLSVRLYRWFLTLLEEFLRARPIGEIIAQEMGVRFDLGERVSIRKPDLAISCDLDWIEENLQARSLLRPCDVCIELISDSTEQEVERDTVTKRAEYQQAGVGEYYILDRLGEHTAFYQLDDKGVYQPIEEEGGVIRSRVLEGFAFRLEHLEQFPPFEQLIDDSVYRPFIMQSLQQERLAKEQALSEKEQERLAKEQALSEKEQERLAKEQERLAKEQALSEKEHLRRLLQQSGVDPDA